MPELPDILAYREALEGRVAGWTIEAVRLASPFLVRSVEPPLSEIQGRRVLGVSRIGKRIVFALAGGLFLILHLMIAGRLHWKRRGAKIGGRTSLLALDFSDGTLLLTEASKKKRASLHLVRGEEALAAFDRGGLDVLSADLRAFRAVLARENRTLKRALTDPRLFDGIGNAYSDEILHAARLSPATWTTRLSEEESERLFRAARATLEAWSARLVAEAASGFPEKVTAFREGMAVHGRYGKPCPDCGSPVQRIVYAENESNYCAACQTGGKLLADRALSQLLKGDWPKTLEELEERKGAGREVGAPLTPTLSPLGGRGSFLGTTDPTGRSFRAGKRIFRSGSPEGLPLPAGEGRGEGQGPDIALRPPHPRPLPPRGWRGKPLGTEPRIGRPLKGRGEGIPSKVPLARELRGRPTIAESKLWWHLRRRALFGVKFRRQHPIGGFIVDFYCDERKLAIELDGGGHADAAKKASDAARTAKLKRFGIRVLRFWNTDVLRNLDGVLQRIGEAVRPPSP